MTEIEVNLPATAKAPFHVLTLTPFYPTSSDDGQGCFVAEPLQWMPSLGMVSTVIAVQPFYRTYAVSSTDFPSLQARYISFPGGLGLPSAGAFLFASLLRTVRELHRTNPVHMIHAHAALPCGHAGSLLGREIGVPFVVTVHGLDAYSRNQVAGHAGNWCQHVSQFVYGSSACVICISEKVRDAVLQGASKKLRTEVVYNGVDQKVFAPSTVEGKKSTVLSVGNLIPIKGHELLLRAVAAVHAKFPNLVCEIIGDGPERSNLVKLSTALGIESKVVFHSRKNRKAIAEAMRRCTIFALPSTYEGLGCVYLEAMASGKPAIACRGQGIDEIIEHGANGWLITPGSLAELTEALSQLMEDQTLRDEMGREARQTVLRDFTLAHQAARLSHLYHECAG